MSDSAEKFNSPGHDLVRFIRGGDVELPADYAAALEGHYSGLATKAIDALGEKPSDETLHTILSLADSLTDRQLDPDPNLDDETYYKGILATLEARREPREVIEAFLAHTGAKKLTAKDLAQLGNMIGEMSKEQSIVMALSEEMLDHLLSTPGLDHSLLGDTCVMMFICGAADVSYELNFGNSSATVEGELVIAAVKKLGEELGIDQTIINAIAAKLSE